MATPGRSPRPVARRVASSLAAAAIATVALLACTVSDSAASARPATARVAVVSLVRVSALVSGPSFSHPSVSLFCTKAESATSTVPGAASASDTTKALQAAYNSYKAAEPYVLANSPSQIRPDVQTVFNFAGRFWALLSKAHFDFMKIPSSSFTSLASNQTQVTKAIKAIDAYLKAHCPGYKG